MCVYIYILRQKNRLYKRLTRFISRKEKRKTEIRKIFPMFTRKKKKKENKTLARQPKCKYSRHSPLSKFKKPFSRPSPRLILNYEHLAFSHSTEATCTRIWHTMFGTSCIYIYTYIYINASFGGLIGFEGTSSEKFTSPVLLIRFALYSLGREVC